MSARARTAKWFYLRFAFVGQITGHDSQHALDAGISLPGGSAAMRRWPIRPGCAAPWCLSLY